MPDREDGKLAMVDNYMEGCYFVRINGRVIRDFDSTAFPNDNQGIKAKTAAEEICDWLNTAVAALIEKEREEFQKTLLHLGHIHPKGTKERIEEAKREAAVKALERAADIGKAHTMLFTRADPAFVTTYEIEIRSLADRYANGEEKI